MTEVTKVQKKFEELVDKIERLLVDEGFRYYDLQTPVITRKNKGEQRFLVLTLSVKVGKTNNK